MEPEVLPPAEPAPAGEALMVRGDALTDADHYAPAVMAKAYDLFLNTSLDITDIAVNLSLPNKVVASWARRGKWLERKRAIEAVLFQEAEDKYKKFVIDNRLPTLERHLKSSGNLEEVISAVIDVLHKDTANISPETLRKLPSQLKMLGDALSSATAISARTVGITDKPFSEHGQEGTGKRPLILIGVQGSVSVTEGPA